MIIAPLLLTLVLLFLAWLATRDFETRIREHGLKFMNAVIAFYWSMLLNISLIAWLIWALMK